MNAKPERTRRLFSLVLAAATLGSGCAFLAPAPPQPRRGMLTELPADLSQAPQRGAASVTLLVATPQTQRAYDTTQMAYTLRDHEIAYYRDHEWGATPSEMMQPLLVSTLERTKRFAAVLQPPQLGRSTYVLQTQITELVQDFVAQNAAVRLLLHVQLIHNVTHRATSKEILVREPMERRSPEAGIAAANRATAKALREVARFVLDNVVD